MRRWMIGLLVMLAACGSAATPTENPPTPVPTLVPLSDLDLEPLLIQDGDLPAGFSGAQVLDSAPPMFKDAPPPLKAWNYRFQSDADNAGGVSVLLYSDAQDVEKAYADTLDGMGDDLIDKPDLGEGGQILAVQVESVKISEGLFRRCHAVIHVRFIGINDERATESYLERLDKRLQPLVCR